MSSVWDFLGKELLASSGLSSALRAWLQNAFEGLNNGQSYVLRHDSDRSCGSGFWFWAHNGLLTVPLQFGGGRGGRESVCVVYCPHAHTLPPPSCSRSHACFRVHGAPLLSPIFGRDKWQLAGRRGSTEQAVNVRSEAQRGPATKGGGAGGEEPAPVGNLCLTERRRYQDCGKTED